MVEREITEPVDLCLPDGRLNPAATGWTRRPLHRANLRGWGRTKRWEYWGIVTPTHIVGVVASSLDYAGVNGLYVLDRASGVETVRDAIVPFARGAVFPDRSGTGRAGVTGGGIDIDIDQRPDGTVLRAAAAGIELDVVVGVPDRHESLGVVVPWGPRRFQYTVKDLGRPVTGRLRLPDGEHPVPEGSFAVLDHGRGRWPYAVTWTWVAGCGTGRAIQLGGRWTDGTGMTENALFVDGRLHKIGEVPRWEYDRSDRLRPWRITGTRLDLTLHPFHERRARTNLLVVASEMHQCFGEFSGWASLDDGTRVELDGLVGWVEEARNRW